MTADDRRTAMLDRLADYVLAHGLPAASLRALAEAVGTSDRMLLYYFKDKAEIMAATIGVVAQRLVAILELQKTSEPLPLERLRAVLVPIVLDDALWPYMCVWLEMASMAARGDPFYRTTGEQIARGFLAWGAAQLASATPAQRDADAAQLLVSIEGMALLRSVGLGDVCQLAL